MPLHFYIYISTDCPIKSCWSRSASLRLSAPSPTHNFTNVTLSRIQWCPALRARSLYKLRSRRQNVSLFLTERKGDRVKGEGLSSFTCESRVLIFPELPASWLKVKSQSWMCNQSCGASFSSLLNEHILQLQVTKSVTVEREREREQESERVSE